MQQTDAETPSSVDPIDLQELNNDQRRERVNTEQRFAAWRTARSRKAGFRGSLVWHDSNGSEYLLRSYYDSAGIRRQKVEGPRNPDTEASKAAWESGRSDADLHLRERRDALDRQAAVNRALGLGRVPLIGARILRALDDAGLLGNGIRVIGTNAIYAYEAAAGIMVDPGITATLDIDLLMDARRALKIAVSQEVSDGTLIGLLRKVDSSFERQQRTDSAANRDGYLVDLIKPEAKPPWAAERTTVGQAADELDAIAIDGLAWQQSAPSFEAMAIDERGGALRIVATDPRVFAAHKLWMSERSSRDPVKRRRDRAQAAAVVQIVSRYLSNLDYTQGDLRMLPRRVFADAAPLFTSAARSDG